MGKRKKLFNYYDYVNYYGSRMFAIAAVDAMPKNYSQVLFTGSMKECLLRLDPPGLEGSVEDYQKRIKVASLK
jgi:hypothetical protein